jgi:ABC-type glutathione transport system ATPase component
VDIDIRLPNGEVLPGGDPVVIIGPNGSGKTRKAREIGTPTGGQVEFVNALRNTRVAPELPAMGHDAAQSQYISQRNQARANHWDLSSEFDVMLSRLIGEHSDAAMRFTSRFRDDPASAGIPEETALTRVNDLWKRVFVGRQLRWENWKPTIDNITTGSKISYSGNFMSDGEKAALYLAGRVFITEPGAVLVVDEPETHFHPLLAIRLWDELEAARPDLRFVYITHDLTFAISRTNCT